MTRGDPVSDLSFEWQPDPVYVRGMDTAALVLLALIFVIALLYSSVGQAGGSGYLAAMAIMGMSPAAMKPTALCLNIVVALIATIRFARAGYFSCRLFWPFALGSVPFSFIGGVLVLPSPIYKGFVGVLLLSAAGMLIRKAEGDGQNGESPAPGQEKSLAPEQAESPFPDRASAHAAVPTRVAVGGVIGLVSGMIGIGGGIFLSPIVLLRGWAGERESAGLAAPFILVNSIAALAGHFLATGYVPTPAPLWAAAAAVGGVIGAGLGSRRLSPTAIRRILALVLLIAALKLITTM
jgi:uncharacterized membrane protein YfcA